MLPDYAVFIPMNISADDSMSASINLLNYEKNIWILQLFDLTNGENFIQQFTYNSTKSSAEFIVERPTISNQITSLANFGNITFTEAQVNINNNIILLGQASASQVHMTDRRNFQLTTVSSINLENNGFTVQYVSSG